MDRENFMDSCHYEPDLIEYMEGALSPSQSDEIREHLAHCPVCPETLRELQSVVNTLNDRTRPAVPQSLFRDYLRGLDARFRSAHRFRHLISSLRHRWESIRNTVPLLARVMHATAWILVGVFLGAFLFSPHGNNPSQLTENSRLLLPALSTSDMESLGEFLTKTEILMLAITNSSDQDPGVKTEYSFEQAIATQLLQQAGLMEKHIARTGDQALKNYMDQLEKLLVAISNAGTSDSPQRIAELKQDIRRNKLLTESRRLYETIQNYLQQRKYASAYTL